MRGRIYRLTSAALRLLFLAGSAVAREQPAGLAELQETTIVLARTPASWPIYIVKEGGCITRKTA
jgi:hypothetical protein